MLKKSMFILAAAFITTSLIFSSCGGGGGGGAKAPEVAVINNPSTGSNSDGDTAAGGNSGSNTTNNGNSTAGTGGSGNGSGDSSLVLIIKVDDSGNLNINNETLVPSQYDQPSEITVKDEHNTTVDCTVDSNGNILVKPADGSVEGTYTVVINTGDREYILVITVPAAGDPVITSAISYPSGSSMAVDLDHGNLIVNNETVAVVSSGTSGKYSQDSSVSSIAVTDSNGNTFNGVIDKITGDIIINDSTSGPYNVVITMTDGRVITFQTDSTGKVTGNVTVAGRAVMVDLDGGSLSSDGYSFILTGESGGAWYLLSGVEILSATAGGGTVTVELSNIKVNSSGGDIMITGGGSSTVPAGPYEIKVSVDGKLYIIKADETGRVTGIIPGNILLDLQEGYAVHSGNNIVNVAVKSSNSWGVSTRITSLKGVTESGSDVALNIDRVTGDIVTPDTASGEVTLTFIYTDIKGNKIFYTIVVLNGSVKSYTAEISEPAPDFDFSTVTNIKISLKVADEKTGLPIGQASINLLKADGENNWHGFTNENGISVFTATVDSAGSTAKIVVTHSGYENVDCSINGIGKLIEFGKNIAMKPKEAAVITDTDGDGVADADDQYPNDPEGAKMITGVYTIAFEDLYPNKGDADFNDLVVRLTVVEKIDSQNMLRSVELKTKLLAAGAGNTNRFGINIRGNRIILIDNPKALMGTESYTYYEYGKKKTGTRERYNSRSDESYLDIPEVSSTLKFDNPVQRIDVAPMPYDPFIVCNGVAANEVHLPFVKTSFTGKVLDSDKFPWAILVPDSWGWPYESGSIFKAYPEFDDWYFSDGVNSADWYLRPASGYVYKK